MGHHELKMCQKHLFWHSMWSKTIFEKSHFFLHPVLTHFGTHLFGLPPTACRSLVGTGV